MALKPWTCLFCRKLCIITCHSFFVQRLVALTTKAWTASFITLNVASFFPISFQLYQQRRSYSDLRTAHRPRPSGSERYLGLLCANFASSPNFHRQHRFLPQNAWVTSRQLRGSKQRFPPAKPQQQRFAKLGLCPSKMGSFASKDRHTTIHVTQIQETKLEVEKTTHTVQVSSLTKA